MRKLNKKGVAILLVASLVLVAVPVTLVMLNLSTSQKEQSSHYNNVLNVEQISLSGINMGYSKLKSGYDRGYRIFPGEISGKDRFDLNMTPTGSGFFKQDIYLLLSKAKEGKNSSIIMADAEQFQQEETDKPVLVITHDYWTTPEPLELGVAADVISLKNFRGKDQLRAMDVKKFEMDCDENQYKAVMNSLKKDLPPDVCEVWDTVVLNASNDKIYGDDTPQPDVVGAGYKTVSKGTGSKKNTGSNKTTGSNKSDSSKKSSSGSPKPMSKDNYSQGLDDMDRTTTSSDSSSSKTTTTSSSKNKPTNTTAQIEQEKGERRAREAQERQRQKSSQTQTSRTRPTNTTAAIEQEKGEKRAREAEEKKNQNK